VVSGEITRVHQCMVSILHEHWQYGMRAKPLDDTLYWPAEYVKLKESLRIKEYTTGLTKSADHVNKINRNPEKIRKTAEKHRGMKR
jgi:hypothetical protein